MRQSCAFVASALIRFGHDDSIRCIYWTIASTRNDHRTMHICVLVLAARRFTVQYTFILRSTKIKGSDCPVTARGTLFLNWTHMVNVPNCFALRNKRVLRKRLSAAKNGRIRIISIGVRVSVCVIWPSRGQVTFGLPLLLILPFAFIRCSFRYSSAPHQAKALRHYELNDCKFYRPLTINGEILPIFANCQLIETYLYFFFLLVLFIF